ncbi:hypothetical protein L3V82_03960 [Thiotrichales bacterium 19S3-7]|nr:hypothetical protein [Thiotrichales bacterium 19S3-7]MCF6801829.1 hypothetical protein [Thiotrichales bacterium 19S3-11]
MFKNEDNLYDLKYEICKEIPFIETYFERHKDIERDLVRIAINFKENNKREIISDISGDLQIILVKYTEYVLPILKHKNNSSLMLNNVEDYLLKTSFSDLELIQNLQNKNLFDVLNFIDNDKLSFLKDDDVLKFFECLNNYKDINKNDLLNKIYKNKDHMLFFIKNLFKENYNNNEIERYVVLSSTALLKHDSNIFEKNLFREKIIEFLNRKNDENIFNNKWSSKIKSIINSKNYDDYFKKNINLLLGIPLENLSILRKIQKSIPIEQISYILDRFTLENKDKLILLLDNDIQKFFLYLECEDTKKQELLDKFYKNNAFMYFCLGCIFLAEKSEEQYKYDVNFLYDNIENFEKLFNNILSLYDYDIKYFVEKISPIVSQCDFLFSGISIEKSQLFITDEKIRKILACFDDNNDKDKLLDQFLNNSSFKDFYYDYIYSTDKNENQQKSNSQFIFKHIKVFKKIFTDISKSKKHQEVTEAISSDLGKIANLYNKFSSENLQLNFPERSLYYLMTDKAPAHVKYLTVVLTGLKDTKENRKKIFLYELQNSILPELSIQGKCQLYDEINKARTDIDHPFHLISQESGFHKITGSGRTKTWQNALHSIKSSILDDIRCGNSIKNNDSSIRQKAVSKIISVIDEHHGRVGTRFGNTKSRGSLNMLFNNYSNELGSGLLDIKKNVNEYIEDSIFKK